MLFVNISANVLEKDGSQRYARFIDGKACLQEEKAEKESVEAVIVHR